MKQPTFNGKELLPLSVMEAAHAGDAMAMEQVLRYYEGYINKLCTRTLYDSNGFPYYRAKRRLRLVKENTEYEEDLYRRGKAADAD